VRQVESMRLANDGQLATRAALEEGEAEAARERPQAAGSVLLAQPAQSAGAEEEHLDSAAVETLHVVGIMLDLYERRAEHGGHHVVDVVAGGLPVRPRRAEEAFDGVELRRAE
jgi:hypothetical protein